MQKKIGVHNCFDIIRRDAKTGEILGEYKAENIILTNFWAKYLSTTSNTCLAYIHFGTGTTTPVASDVKLTKWLGYKAAPAYNATGTIYDFSTYHTDGIVKIKKSVRLEDTEYNGSFISEVGYSSSTSGTTGLLTKALVKDMNGNVVSIEKKSGEVLDIFATFFIDFGKEFDGGNISFGQIYVAEGIGKMLLFCSPFTSASLKAGWIVGRPQMQAINAATDSNTDGEYFISDWITLTFDTANKKLIMTIPNLVARDGNLVGGFRGVSITGGLHIKLPCTGLAQPVLPKEVLGTGDGTTVNFQSDFGYIKDNGTAKLYINDVEQTSGFTIDYGKPYPKVNIFSDLVIVDFMKLNSTGMPQINPSTGNAVAPGYTVVENPFYATIPINSVYGSKFKAYASNDLTNWTLVASSTSTSATIAVTAGYENYRYWKFTQYSEGSTTEYTVIKGVLSTNGAARTNIHFTTPPAVGATVALDYQPDCIAKDAAHVINNNKVEIVFNEYTP